MNIKVVQIATIALFAITAFLIWQIVDSYPQIAVIQENIKAQESTIKDSEETLKRLKGLVAFTAENKESIKKFDLILPPDEERANLLSSLDSLASANGLSTLKIFFEQESVSAQGAESKKSDFDTINVRMSMRGSYISFKSFLTAIEKNLRVTDIVSADFSSEATAKEGEEKKSYLFNVGLKTYAQKPVKEENIFKLLSVGKYKNISVKQLNFVKEKVFNGLSLPPNYDVNAGVGEIGNQDIF